MIKSGISHALAFLVSLVVGNAMLILLKTYLPSGYAFFLRFGKGIALIFKISYDSRTMAAFVLATLLSFFVGMLFYKLFKLGR
ncbi:MAG: hypothetical protein OS130_14370 [Thermodesulfobacteriota bacterium]|jgi:hypothetical protein|nr:MAG: hypothetical protein OS130_14370 [Thermodesulfobacteriota bacterium]